MAKSTKISFYNDCVSFSKKRAPGLEKICFFFQIILILEVSAGFNGIKTKLFSLALMIS